MMISVSSFLVLTLAAVAAVVTLSSLVGAALEDRDFAAQVSGRREVRRAAAGLRAPVPEQAGNPDIEIWREMLRNRC